MPDILEKFPILQQCAIGNHMPTPAQHKRGHAPLGARLTHYLEV
jgi:hypothetical protein